MSQGELDKKFVTEPPNSWHMIRALGGVGLLCSLLIVFTFQATLPRITRNKAEFLGKAIFQVLPGASTRASFLVTDNNYHVVEKGGFGIANRNRRQRRLSVRQQLLWHRALHAL